MAKKKSLLLPILTLLIVILLQTEGAAASGKENENATVYEKDFEKEFKEFCEKQDELRNDPDSIKRDCKRIHEKGFHNDDLRMLFMLFMIILWGAIVRALLKALKINLPYTVVLMLSGMIFGAIARYECFSLHTYTAIARIRPSVILMSFLPILIFETAFGISSHVFVKAAGQILILAFPGMIIATALTAMLCYQFFAEYKWTFLQALFYGSIISATDPVAVVAILKEVGVSEALSVIVDGESLLNDGVAILFFEIFEDLVKDELAGGSGSSAGEMAKDITLKFLQIAVGGPFFGWFMAKIAILCLSRIFNDAIVEITITLVSAYLTYYIAEDVLGVSGVCAVVLLGITMSSEKTAISPETLDEVKEFWEMAAHLANTVLFFITGIIITERGSRDLQARDVYYLILFYVAVNFIRFAMLVILSPLLSRTGYGLDWRNLVVMMWGGLRGGVGICLSLTVYEDTSFCFDRQFGPKILFHTAGIVLLTLLINGTTTKKLLDMLGLTAISAGQIEEMQITVKHLNEMQLKTVAMLKHDRYLSDANWDYILNFTKIADPYRNALVKQRKPKPESSLLSVHEDTHKHPCPECNALVENEPSNEEYRAMTEEARLRVLKAMTISFWRQFEQGVLTEDALKVLVATCDTFVDKELAMVHTSHIIKYCKLQGIMPFIRAKMIQQFGPDGKFGVKKPPKPKTRCRACAWWIVTKDSFDAFMTFVVTINMIPGIFEFILDIETASNNDPCDKTYEIERYYFLIINWIFTVLYTVEFVLKVLGLGCKGYWASKWNSLDFFVLSISLLDVFLGLLGCSRKSVGFTKILRGLRLFRIIRSLRLLRYMIPCIMSFLNARVNREMFSGYDLAVGYLTAMDDVTKYINHMAENPHVAKKLRTHLDTERAAILKEIGLIQRDHPGIAIAVKTRHASRCVLNQMRAALEDLRMDGLLDEKENQLLTDDIEKFMKRLWNSPSYIAPASYEMLMQNLSWVYGNDELKEFIFNHAPVVVFKQGDVILAKGDIPSGLYVIVSGMVKITYEPDADDAADRKTHGRLPSMEVWRDFEFDKPLDDYFGTGTVIGESGFMTRRPRGGTVICESEEVKAYFLPYNIMEEAKKFNHQYDTLEARLWRSCGIRRGSAFLPSTNFYKTWSIEKIRMHLERSCCPLGSNFDVIEIPPYVLDIFVFEGYVQDFDTGNMFVAPCLVSRSCSKLICNVENPKTMNRILLITQDNIGNPEADDELAAYVIASTAFRRGLPRKPDEDDQQPKGFFTLLHFGARQKLRKRRVYVADDEKPQKDVTIRRRANINPAPTRAPHHQFPGGDTPEQRP